MILTEEIIKSPKLLGEFLIETIKNELPDSLKDHLSKKSNREKMKEKFGDRAFLNPDELKYPVINPFTEDYDCRLIYAAYVRSRQHKHKDIEIKAKDLYDSNDCRKEVNIKINENEIIACHEFFDFFDVE